MQPLDEPKSRFGPGVGACEEPSMKEQRLGHEQHQRKQQPHCEAVESSGEVTSSTGLDCARPGRANFGQAIGRVGEQRSRGADVALDPEPANPHQPATATGPT